MCYIKNKALSRANYFGTNVWKELDIMEKIRSNWNDCFTIHKNNLQESGTITHIIGVFYKYADSTLYIYINMLYCEVKICRFCFSCMEVNKFIDCNILCMILDVAWISTFLQSFYSMADVKCACTSPRLKVLVFHLLLMYIHKLTLNLTS